MKNTPRMFHALLITLGSLVAFVASEPLLVASPYPFNTSKSSHIECFSNDQGSVLSLTITASLLPAVADTSSLQATNQSVVRNGSVVLTIPALFNYSQMLSQIECRSNYHHGEQRLSQLEVFSVAEIPGKQLLSLSSSTNQLITIHCLTYGTNVVIHWDFSPDLADEKFSALPLGIRITFKFALNDTLIIDHVSYSDHHGYYRCNATNHFGDVTYEDRSVFFLNVKKSSVWVPIIIVCTVIGMSILVLTLCSKYWGKRRKRQLQVTDQPTTTPMDIAKEERLADQKTISQTGPALSAAQQQERNPPIVRESPQFVLGSPFLDRRAQPVGVTTPSTSKII